MLALALAALLAVESNEDVIKTKDGAEHVGHILSETHAGYLLREGDRSWVVPYADIVEVRRPSKGAAPAQATEPRAPVTPPPPVAAPPMPAPGSAEALLMVQREEHVSRLIRERQELRDELNEATYAGPIFKLVGGTAFAALGCGLVVAYGNSFNGYERSTALLTGAITAGAAAIALYIWGGLQLRNRVDANQRLPREIDAKSEKLRMLGVY